MTTPQALGFVTPTGDDYLNKGDDAISTNAQAAAAMYDTLLAASPYRGTIAPGTDLNTVTQRGIYEIPYGATWDTLANAPTTILGTLQAGWLAVDTTANGLRRHVLGVYGADPKEAWRTTASVTAGTWTVWKRHDNAATTPIGLANALRVSDFSTRRGGTKYTNGLGAVALRFDHGLANLKTKIYPLLAARSLPFSVGINARNWSLPENAGTTAVNVQSWITAGLAEVWNHGAHHNDATTYNALEDTIVAGLSELRAQFPGTAIDGFIVPGVGGTNYKGFNSGATPSNFYDTDAGRLILANHAVSTGAFTGTARRVLDGTVRQGQAHYSMEAQTYASIKAQIDAAKTEKTGLQLFLHPSLIDTPGYITTATLTQVLDYIKTERDAGRLAVLSPYDMMLADSGTATVARTAAAETRVTALETAKVTIDNTVGRRAFAWDAGNARKQMIYGDTGMRDITALMNPGFAPSSYGNVYVRRIGQLIELSISNMKRTGAGTSEAFIMPPGFKPQNSRYNSILNASGGLSSFTIAYNGVVTVSTTTLDPVFNLNLTFSAIDPWPTVLPGITTGNPL